MTDGALGKESNSPAKAENCAEGEGRCIGTLDTLQVRARGRRLPDRETIAGPGASIVAAYKEGCSFSTATPSG